MVHDRNIEKILTKYKEKQLAYFQAARLVTRACQRLASDLGFKEVLFGSRKKTSDSLRGKLLDSKGRKYQLLSDLPDLAGARVVLDSLHHVTTFTKEALGYFEVEQLHTTIGRHSVGQVGYRARHFVVKVNQGLVREFGADLEGVEEGVLCELQIKTLLSHAWAQTQRNLELYKGSHKYRRILRHQDILAALFELGDEIVSEDAKSVAGFKQSVSLVQSKEYLRREHLELILNLPEVKLVAELAAKELETGETWAAPRRLDQLVRDLRELEMFDTASVLGPVINHGNLIVELLSWPEPIQIANPAVILLLCLAAEHEDRRSDILARVPYLTKAQLKDVVERLAAFHPAAF